MKAYEIKGRLSKDGNIIIPKKIKNELKPVKNIKVIILYGNEEWENYTVKEFHSGYSKQDEIYDKL